MPTLCGRIVNYDQANGSLTNVDCPACIHAADSLVNHYVASVEEMLQPALAKLRARRDS